MISDPETADASLKKNKQKSMVPFVNVSYHKAVVFQEKHFQCLGLCHHIYMSFLWEKGCYSEAHCADG